MLPVLIGAAISIGMGIWKANRDTAMASAAAQNTQNANALQLAQNTQNVVADGLFSLFNQGMSSLGSSSAAPEPASPPVAT